MPAVTLMGFGHSICGWNFPSRVLPHQKLSEFPLESNPLEIL
jgi:hypothetical protein